MNIFDMGIMEIVMIIIVAVVIWGPDKIPQVARTIGKTIAALKKASQELTAQITSELEEEKKELPGQKIESGSTAARTNQDEEARQPEGPETDESEDSPKVDKQ
ncbi:MAG: twin-arginine translocase TatA/TatE family subunit [Dehalococcoidales bacterium]